MYTGLTVIAFHILIIGPIKDLVKHETVFTESLQNINGKIFLIAGGYWSKLFYWKYNLFIQLLIFLILRIGETHRMASIDCLQNASR